LIGGYRIESLIASGGMGLVYDAYELACERRVALKVIAPEFANDSQFRHRFVDEARIAMRLEHPHVVPVHAAGMVDGVLFMVMRKIDGVDLGALIARARGLDAARAIALVDQVASGLDAAHSLGLVHRDIKPANIMVQKLDFAREHAYIMDFGLAKQAGSRGVTRPDDLLGTLDYIAPEQIVGGRVDARTDVYALGASLFHALSGHAPFAGDHHAAKIFAHLTARPPKITDSRPDLPETFDSVLARAMAKNPADRFSSAGALARSLCEAQNDTCWRYWARA
jgi:serine/threonine protein kinase